MQKQSATKKTAAKRTEHLKGKQSIATNHRHWRFVVPKAIKGQQFGFKTASS
jgi:hypothetical protein